MYAGDNRGRIMRTGAGNEFLTGAWADARFRRQLFRQRRYLGIVPGLPGRNLGTISVSTPARPVNRAPHTLLNSINTQLRVFRCPSNPDPPNNGTISYTYLHGQRGNCPVTIDKLDPGGKADPVTVRRNRPHSSAIMWCTAARKLPTTTGTTTPADPSGGNVVSVDGSVQWFPWWSGSHARKFDYFVTGAGRTTASEFPAMRSTFKTGF